MGSLIRGGFVFRKGVFWQMDILVSDGVVSILSEKVPVSGHTVFEVNNCFIFPGFTDVHVH